MSNILGRRSDTEQQQQLAKYANRLDIQKIHTSVTLFFLFVFFILNGLLETLKRHFCLLELSEISFIWGY